MVTAFKEFTNFAGGALNAGISDSDTSIVLESGQGATFPASGDFVVLIHSGSPDVGSELVKVGGRTGDTLTGCTRGYESTTAQTWSAGAFVENILTQEALEDIHDAINALESGGGGGITINNASDNRIATTDDASTLNGEANLTFDGSTLGLTGTLSVSGAAVINESGADVDTRIESDNNANMFYVDAGNDRIGIGTSTPDSEFEIYRNDASVLDILKLTQAGVGDTLIHFSLDGGQSFTMGIDNSDSDKFKIAASSVLATSTLATLQTNGRLGLGTTTPAGNIHVAIDSGSINSGITGLGTVAAVFSNTSAPGDNCLVAIQAGTAAIAGIYFGDNAGNPYDGYIRYHTNTQDLQFWTASTNRMIIGSDGSVSINPGGTAAAATTDCGFDIQGNKAVKLPIVTTTERNAFTPAEGMFIYNSTTQKLNFYDGAHWRAVTST